MKLNKYAEIYSLPPNLKQMIDIKTSHGELDKGSMLGVSRYTLDYLVGEFDDDFREELEKDFGPDFKVGYFFYEMFEKDTYIDNIRVIKELDQIFKDNDLKDNETFHIFIDW
jgi:hypothetical protein